MKICITSQGETLESQVDPRFGRCQYFIIADSESLEFEAIPNPNVQAMGGAGIQSAQLVAGKDVKLVLTGNVGPNAFRTLQAAGMEIVVGASGTVREAVEKYKKGEFPSATDASVGAKFGVGAGRGMPGTPSPRGRQAANRDEEIRALQEQAKELEEQLKQINQRLGELKEGK